MKQPPRFVLKQMQTAPKAGHGFNNWLFRTARVMHCCYTEHEIYNFLRSEAEKCGRVVKDNEIWNAIKNSKPDFLEKHSFTKAPTWPEVNASKRKEILGSLITLEHLTDFSPSKPKSEDVGKILDLLFPGDPLLCVARSKFSFETERKSHFMKNPQAYQLIVPSPMSKALGEKADGSGLSSHTKDNTGPRKYLVIEFDKATFDEQATIIWHLAKAMPSLVMCVHSGGKSLHGWFFVEGVDEKKLHNFMRYAVSLGADSATWNKSQFMRYPFGRRDNGAIQNVVYLNLEESSS